MKLCLYKVTKSDACIRPLFANPVTFIKSWWWDRGAHLSVSAGSNQENHDSASSQDMFPRAL